MSAEAVHRLGVTLCAVAAVWSLARALGSARRERRARGRSALVLPVEPLPVVGPAAGGRIPTVRARIGAWLPAVGAVAACWVFVGGVPGIVLGLAAGFGMWRWRSRPAPVAEFDADLAARQLPLAADLLAACIAAGAGPVAAARAVGEALEGPVGQRLARGAAEVRLGGEPAEAWSGLASLPGARELARLLERAGESGVPAAVPVARLAAGARAEWGRLATVRARRAGVLVTAPVGLCFLPAFIAIGVLPVVIGLADGVLGGGGR
ncbi:type II secretion system F family protein [Streptomyces fructofermentans]|uniref:type II secretion system F family protein n=1 Tax=Streptomyces fructofermentans TaxID=152141 RepID=UPI0037AF946C